MYLPNQQPGAPFPPPTLPVTRLADETVLTKYGTTAYFKADPAASRCNWCLSVIMGKRSVEEMMQIMKIGRPRIAADLVRYTTAALLHEAGFVAFESRWEGHVSVMYGEPPVTPWEKCIQNAFKQCFDAWAAEEGRDG